MVPGPGEGVAAGWIEVKTESKFGGIDTKRIAIKVSGT
jgi:hypothetical protein